ncbi:MAG: hypothetical protein R6V85_01695 [Polyangia bacterium]
MPIGKIPRILTAALLLAATASCGGAEKGDAKSARDEVRLDAQDVEPRAVLAEAVLTTEADEKRYRALAPEREEFAPDQEVIYLVGELRRVPTDSAIELRWMRDADPEPLLVTESRGSDEYRFVSSLAPPAGGFVPGPYTVRVFVGERPVGSASFRISGEDPAAAGIRVERLAVSLEVRRGMRPRRPARRFPGGISKLHATFGAENTPIGGDLLTVTWLRKETPFHEEELEIDGDGRFGASLVSPDGLPDGSYRVEVRRDEKTIAKKSFWIGKRGDGPAIDRVAIGTRIGPGGALPADMESIPRRSGSIICGLRFLDLAPGSTIEVLWNAVDGDETSLWHETRTPVPDGGSGAMTASWDSPAGGFEPGPYRVLVNVNGKELASVDFEIE